MRKRNKFQFPINSIPRKQISTPIEVQNNTEKVFSTSEINNWAIIKSHSHQTEKYSFMYSRSSVRKHFSWKIFASAAWQNMKWHTLKIAINFPRVLPVVNYSDEEECNFGQFKTNRNSKLCSRRGGVFC